MLEVPIADNQMVTVMVVQTSFAVLTMPGMRFRVDFLGKAEIHLKPGVRGKFLSYSEHPLLLKYSNCSGAVYINSRPEDPASLFIAIQARIQALLQGWRNWHSVLSGGADQLQKHLLDGSGILLQDAPRPIVKAVIEACTEQGVLTRTFGTIGEDSQTAPAYRLLLVGKHYVIARDFLFTEVLTEKAPLPSQSA